MRTPALCALFFAACGSGFPDAIDAGDTNPQTDGSTGEVMPTVLPFAVDDWYGPSGYMGDGENPGAITDAQTCLPSRPSTWIGNCHRYTWTPSGTAWAGVYWQYPDGNWGDRPGLTIPSGATAISFQAWGATGSEKVDFMVGMMAVDGFEIKQTEVALTTTPTKYTLSIAGTSYAKVVGGFGWVAKEATAPMTFGIDDIRWE